MDSIELTFILTAILGLLIYVFLVYNFNYWKKRGVEGPKPRPLFGNTPSVITQARNMIYEYDTIYREYKSKERFVGMFSLRSPQLMIIDPALCQEVLVTNFRSFNENEFSKMISKDVDPILGRNPFFLSGAEWKEKRAEITPALTINRVKASYPVMLEVCNKMTKYLETETRKPLESGVNAKELAARFTTEVVANCIYGIEAGAFSENPCEIRDNGTKLMQSTFTVMIYFIIASIFPKLLKIYRVPLVSRNIQAFFTKLMEDAIRLRKETKSDRVDFLNYLLHLQEKKNLSTLDMAAHTMTFFLDGFETSSIVISNCLHLLAENPDAQKRLRDEVNAACSAEGGLTYEKLLDLPYLDNCINETLRLRPPVVMNNKVCIEPCEITTKKEKIIKLEKGDVLVLPYYCIHRDPEYYPEPEKFDPDRYSPENGGIKKYKDMGVFLPFGDGPRICLGMRFGLCQTKAAIVEMVRNWKLCVNPKTKPEFVIDPKQFLCVPEGGIWLDLYKLTN